jgi:hypothetical protein
VTMMPGSNSSRALSRRALWLCSRCSHHRRATYSGTQTVTTSRGCSGAGWLTSLITAAQTVFVRVDRSRLRLAVSLGEPDSGQPEVGVGSPSRPYCPPPVTAGSGLPVGL